MVSSYREEVNKYKFEKQQKAEDKPIPRKKKKVKKTKKADHKHVYVPALFQTSYTNWKQETRIVWNYGFYCEKCGRIQDISFTWGDNKILDKFRKEHPDYRVCILKEDFDIWKDKFVPLTEID